MWSFVPAVVWWAVHRQANGYRACTRVHLNFQLLLGNCRLLESAVDISSDENEKSFTVIQKKIYQSMQCNALSDATKYTGRHFKQNEIHVLFLIFCWFIELQFIISALYCNQGRSELTHSVCAKINIIYGFFCVFGAANYGFRVYQFPFFGLLRLSSAQT